MRPHLRKGFIYSDCWADDARLVIANARAAADDGATILVRTTCTNATRESGVWRATLRSAAGESRVVARALVNVTGPWAKEFLNKNLALQTPFALRLVKGSHILVPQLYSGEHAFILQNDDRRVVFVYPYQERYTLIGTTDVVHKGDPGDAQASDAEVEYLCRAANRYFERVITPADVTWRYCGIRPLFDDGAANPAQVTRDYTLRVDAGEGAAPILSVFGGKITTYRKLAEQALEKLAPWFAQMKPPWTHAIPLPGGALGGQAITPWLQELRTVYDKLPVSLLDALAYRHGDRIGVVLGDARTEADLGQHFGHTLYAREVDYFMHQEWAHTADDILWRRTKAGLHVNTQQKQTLINYLSARPSGVVR